MATSKPSRLQAIALVGLLVWAAGQPANARDAVCKFKSPSGLRLAFGTLDPSSPSATARVPAATADSGAQQVGDCRAGISLSVTVDPGAHFAGGKNRLKHQTLNAYLPYTVTVTPATMAGPGNDIYLRLDVSGSIEGHDYVDLPGGLYTDSLYLVVAP